MKMSPSAVLSSLTCLLLPLCVAAEIPPPREPLTFRNCGLYGGWNDYAVSRESPFDFLVVTATPRQGKDNARWNEWLKKARQNGKRVIANLNPQIKDAKGEYGLSELTSESDKATIDRIAGVADEFFAQVDAKELYAITLAEENIFWNGRTEQLNALYDKIKARHDVPVFQWFSGSSHGSIPGVTGWPNLKSDGWVADEYHLDQPDMERAMRGYRVLQKPIIQIIWAGGDGQSVPFIDKRFAEQIEVCRKYDIPTAYFTYNGKGPAWGWSDDAPPNLKAKFGLVLKTAVQAKSSEKPDGRAWDIVPWEIPTIRLGFGARDDLTPSYREEYAKPGARALRFANDAGIKGFTDVRWDSSAVELRPRQAGKSEASIVYNFESPFELSQLRLACPVFAAPGKDAAVWLTVADQSGKAIETERLTDKGELRLTVPGDSLAERRFKVILAMTGTAQAAGDVLAGINSLDVEANVVLPSEKVIELRSDASGGIAYEEDLSCMAIYHIAEFKNIEKIRHSTDGLHVSGAPGVLEVIQHFRSPEKIALTRLCAKGIADEPGQSARIGIGVSLNGVDVLARKMSEGSFNGELELDLGAMQEQLQTRECYVHLFLEGSYGLIKSYAIRGNVIK